MILTDNGILMEVSYKQPYKASISILLTDEGLSISIVVGYLP